MAEAVIQRIGGSTFARLPPALVKQLGLREGETVQIHILRKGMTVAEYFAFRASNPIQADPSWREGRRTSRADD